MKTTLNISDALLTQLREEAARRGTTMSALAEQGIRLILKHLPASNQDEGSFPQLPTWHEGKPMTDIANGEASTPQEDFPPLPRWDSGGALVDISNRDELYKVMCEEE